MKTREEILNSYYSQGEDGMPEISADGLLKAMEEYRLEGEEAAFNAARAYEDDIIGGKHSYETFADYKAGTTSLAPTPQEPEEGEIIQFIADSILEQFIPNDAGQNSLSFNIRTNGLEYTVRYERSVQGYWSFTGYRPDTD
ncbi:hypothetical protein A0256_12450 [Mucilaginibacter sp. PAMC 26640]|nr:hypothetical protein A0256_12450 [Mucilaginibacter sp. PAMC 26640]